jgi:DNA-binding NtrC family response regulator
MEILIFENQVQDVIEAFEDVNTLDFDNTLNYKWILKSQDFKNFDELKKYDLVIVDIDLSLKSEKDGYGVIDTLKNKYDYHKIVIMTGHRIKDEIEKNGLASLDIINKPIILDDLKEIISKFKPNP